MHREGVWGLTDDNADYKTGSFPFRLVVNLSFALSLSKGRPLWFDKLTTNGLLSSTLHIQAA